MPRVPKTNSQENISETNGEWHKPSTQKYVKYNFVKPYMWQISNNASTHKHESTQSLQGPNQVPNTDLKQELQGPN